MSDMRSTRADRAVSNGRCTTCDGDLLGDVDDGGGHRLTSSQCSSLRGLNCLRLRARSSLGNFSGLRCNESRLSSRAMPPPIGLP